MRGLKNSEILGGNRKEERLMYRPDIGETYNELPRVTSTYNRQVYANLVEVANNIDFNSPIFYGMAKRNRSLGSAQAFIVELALGSEDFRNFLKKFMVRGGEGYLHVRSQYDRIYIDRLAAYRNRRR